MENEKLYVIGNGFDLWHKLPTAYKCYNCYMCMNNPCVHNRVGHIFNRQNANLLWSDYENMLSQMDIVELVRRNIGEWINNPDVVCFSNAFDTLYDDLRSYFHEWVNQIDYTIATNKRLNLDTKARFLNFNYTNTLERFYEIKPFQICYIHGDTGNNEFRKPIVGHGDVAITDSVNSKCDEIHEIVCSYGKIPDWSTNFEDFSNEIVTEIINFLSVLKKDTEHCISEHQTWFDQLNNIHEIYVLGHSLSDIDAPYFRKINTLAPNAKWHVSYYDEEDKAKKVKNFNSIFDISKTKNACTLFTLDELKATY